MWHLQAEKQRYSSVHVFCQDVPFHQWCLLLVTQAGCKVALAVSALGEVLNGLLCGGAGAAR